MTVLKSTLILGIAATLCACSGGAEHSANNAATPFDSEAAVAASESGEGQARFDAALEDDPCTMLTAETVSQVFDVPVSELELFDIVGCEYSWNDGDAVASIGMVDIYEDAASARSSFKMATRSMSAAEVDSAMAKVGEQMQEQGATESEVAGGQKIGQGLFANGIQFDPVENVGDAAVFSYSAVKVLEGNARFNIAAQPPGAQDQAAQREAAARLARAVVAHLDTL